MTDVSIVIVHWSVPDLLESCLRSIASERDSAGLAIETIVVDNDTDSPQLRETLARHSDVRALMLSENRGYAAGCNAGLTAARGASALLLNPDTQLLPGALRTLWETLQIASHVGMVAPLLLNPNCGIQSAGYRFPGVMNVFLDLFPLHPRLIESSINGRYSVGDGVSPYRIDYPLGAAMLVRRSAWQDVGPLDETYGMYCEEIDWAQRFAQHAWTVLLAPSAQVIHYGGQSTTQRPVEMHRSLWESRARYLERWGTNVQRRIIPRLVAVRFRTTKHGDDPRLANVNRLIRERFNRLRPEK